MAVSRSMARRSARASVDQPTAIRSGGSVICHLPMLFTQAEFAPDFFVRNSFSASQ